MEPQDYIITQQLSNTECNNLNKLLHNSFFKKSLNNDNDTIHLINLFQNIEKSKESYTHESIAKFNNEKDYQELLEKKSKEMNKNLLHELKQVKD